ncbi:MAG TPA: HEPN domain-containing protein [Coriobacteriia bacterium]|jgi:hypothetical protein
MLDENCKDVVRLLEIHGQLTQGTPGRKHRVAVLNKSAVMMTCAFWEAYVEDVCAEAVDHLVDHIEHPAQLPMDLRKELAAKIKEEHHELAVWRFADDGWRTVIRENREKLVRERNHSFMSPKSHQVDKLFKETLGIPAITDDWSRPKMDSAHCRVRLDHYVTLRGDLAHRGAPQAPIHKRHCTEFLRHIKRLGDCIDASLDGAVREAGAPALF